MCVRSVSHLLLIVAFLAALLSPVGISTTSLTAAPRLEAAAAGLPTAVPAEFADLYATLDAKLKAIDGYISSRWRGDRHDVLFSTELLAANSNQGEALLRDQAWQSVILSLDALQALGVRGVKVAIKYPVLIPGFPRSAEYLDFFKRLSPELKRRNLTFLAQMTAGFREPAFSSLPVAGHYAGLTHERYRQEKRQMAETIIREIRPDYLTIENEPGTQAHNTGLSVTVQTFTDLVQHVLNGLDRRGVLVGAGAGTWDDLAYTQALARTGVDYIDMHIYPITGDFVVDRAFRIAEIARRAGKKVVLGEAWLYKARESDLRGSAVAAAPGLFARDAFSFWEPLDVEFLTVMGKLSHHMKIDFTSFFWSRYFYGYVEYSDATRRLPPVELFRLANREAARNMVATPPQPTRTGQAFQRLVRPGP
ncbi:MAG: hypothetical protein HY355_04845 [Armatimonadetes bacterium]|nr:hypothetical protein [Armatimonadota bacterium]